MQRIAHGAVVALMAAALVMTPVAAQSPMPSQAPSPVPTSTPGPGASQPTPASASAKWTPMAHPGSKASVKLWALWSDGSIALSHAWSDVKQGRDRSGIWASVDAGRTWRWATIEGAGKRWFRDNFWFSRSGDTYYAFGSATGPASHEDANSYVLRSSDGLRWTIAARRPSLPAGVTMNRVSPSGLLAAAFIGTDDTEGGFFTRTAVDGRGTSRSVRVDAQPVLIGSSDGVRWSVTTQLPIEAGEQGVAHVVVQGADGSSIVLGTVSSGRKRHTWAMWRSDDGRTYERVDAGTFADGSTIPSTINIGAFAGGYYLQTSRDASGPAKGAPSDSLWTSPDGRVWTEHVPPKQPTFAGVTATESGLLVLVEARKGKTTGWLLTGSGEWVPVRGRPFPTGRWVTSVGDRVISARAGNQRKGGPRMTSTTTLALVMGSPTAEPAASPEPAATPDPAGTPDPAVTPDPSAADAPSLVAALEASESARPPAPSSELRLRLRKVIIGPNTPKSVESSQGGLFFVQNNVFRHTIGVYDRRFKKVKTIRDAVVLADHGFPRYTKKVRGAPVEAAFSPDGRFAYVTQRAMYGPGFRRPPPQSGVCAPSDGYDRGFVYKIDLRSLKIRKVIRLGVLPKDLAVSPDGRLLLVSNWCSYDVSVVNLSTDRQVKRIGVGQYPRGIAISPDSRTAYVAMLGERRIARIDLRTLKRSYINGPGGAPRDAIVSPNGRYLYLSLSLGDGVAKLDLRTNRVVARAATGDDPRSMTMAPDGRSLYVVNYASGTVSKIRTRDMRVIQRLRAGRHPVGITYDAATRQVWVSMYPGPLRVYVDR